MKYLAGIVGTYLTLALLAACGQGASVPLLSTPRSVAIPLAQATARVTSASVHAAAGPNLYVANFAGKVTIYAPGSESVLRTIVRGVNSPYALAFDTSRNLLVGDIGPHLVRVYAPGGERPLRTISHRVVDPQALALDSSGNLYVSNFCCNNTITVYAAGSAQLSRRISQGINEPGELAFDGPGNLYVPNLGNSTVTVYAPGTNNVLRTITQGVNHPTALAFDASGNLYIANIGNDTVTVYARGSTLLRTISRGVSPPDVASDRSGNLYVPQHFGNQYRNALCCRHHEYVAEDFPGDFYA